MLVLKRKPRQKVLIGREIIVTVLGSTMNGVRLGIEAPADVPVLRDELSRKPRQRTKAGRS